MAEGGGFFIDSQEVDTQQPEVVRKKDDSSRSFSLVGRKDASQRDSGGPNRSGCSHCVSLSYSEDLYRAFGVYICGACRKDVKMISKVWCCTLPWYEWVWGGDSLCIWCRLRPSSNIFSQMVIYDLSGHWKGKIQGRKTGTQ